MQMTHLRMRAATCTGCGESFDYDDTQWPSGIEPEHCHDCGSWADTGTYLEDLKQGDRVVLEFQNWDYDRKTVIGIVEDAGRVSMSNEPYAKLIGQVRDGGKVSEDMWTVSTRDVCKNGHTVCHHGRPRSSVYKIEG